MKTGSADCNKAISPVEETDSTSVSASPMSREPENFKSVENNSAGAPSHDAA